MANSLTSTASIQIDKSAENSQLITWSHFSSVIFRGLSLTVCILIWHYLSTRHVDLGIITFENVPAPEQVLIAAWELLHSGKLASHLGASLTRVLSGFAAAAIAGITLGLLLGRSKIAEDVLLPPLEVLRPIPAVAWIPLAILMFPSSEFSMVFITFTGALFPILLNTIHGVEEVDPRLIASAQSLGSKQFSLFIEVILPAAAPSIFTGLSIGMGTAWFCLVTAEMIAGQFGIGYYTWAAYTVQSYADIVVGMLLIGVLGMSSSVLIRKIGKWLMPWDISEKKSS